MKSAADHPQELQRVATLLNYEVLDSDQESNFDELTELASAICSTPISLISLVDDQRQWFKSRVGIDASETPKSIAFCSHAILQEHVFEISDATSDERFADNPLVTGAPDIRFYAGAPLVAPNGQPIGTLCVIDTEPKKLSEDQSRALQILSNQVISQLELRKQKIELERSYKQQQSMLASIAHDLRAPFTGILGLSEQLSKRADIMSQERIVGLSHHILSASLSVYQLLDEMLQWSTQRIRGAQITLATHALLPLVNSSFELLEEALRLKNIRYNCDVNPNIHATADATLTKAIVRNLLNNAIKFTPNGGYIQITSTQENGLVTIKVFNTGAPIPETQQATFFNHTTNSEKGTDGESGSGLGLSLCKEFVEAQNGRIWYEATPDGSCFAFSLPHTNN